MLQIYVYLLDEGTDVWRPVDAVQISESVYRIVSRTPTDEKWEFESNELVRCKEKVSSENKRHLVAYERVATKE